MFNLYLVMNKINNMEFSMTIINTVYKPILGHYLGRGFEDAQLCKATDVHYGAYYKGGCLPTYKIDNKVHLGYVVMLVKDEFNKDEFSTHKQPGFEFKTKKMSDKLIREWDKWCCRNSNGKIKSLMLKHNVGGK